MLTLLLTSKVSASATCSSRPRSSNSGYLGRVQLINVPEECRSRSEDGLTDALADEPRFDLEVAEILEKQNRLPIRKGQCNRQSNRRGKGQRAEHKFLEKEYLLSQGDLPAQPFFPRTRGGRGLIDFSTSLSRSRWNPQVRALPGYASAYVA